MPAISSRRRGATGQSGSVAPIVSEVTGGVPMSIVFDDRRDGGRPPAAAPGSFPGRTDLLVLALPRGGVPVGAEVARVLGAPLDVLVVRKLGHPAHPEFAIGAI